MSLFGFVKDIGSRVFDKDEDAAEAIKAHIEGNNPGVTGLEVSFDSGIVNLGGLCENHDAFDQCILMAGNVKGVVDVYSSGLKIKPQPKPEAPAEPAVEPQIVAADPAGPAEQVVPADAPKTEYYVIQSGDTLGKIAQNFYGKASAYMKIFEANRGVIEDPDKIYPGQKIRIPLD